MRTNLSEWLKKIPPGQIDPELSFKALKSAALGGLSNAVLEFLPRREGGDPKFELMAQIAATDGHHVRVLEALASVNLNEQGRLLQAYSRRRCGLASEPVEIGGTDGVLDRMDADRGARWVERLNELYASNGLSALRQVGTEPRFGALEGVAPPATRSGPKVTVLVPAYGAQATLETAVRSVLRQTWANIEVIVVEDCSPDRTGEIADQLAGADYRVRVLRQPVNKGAYAARNAGLAVATGELVTVHDADDWAHPEKIERQVERHMAGAAVTLTASVRVSDDMSLVLRPAQRTYIGSCFPSLMYPMPDVRALGGWDEVRMGADAEFRSRYETIHQTEAVTVLPDVPLTFMLSAPDSLTRAGATSLRSGAYGARREYVDAWKYWHRELKQGGRAHQIIIGGRNFPAPAICCGAGEAIEIEHLLVLDFSQENVSSLARINDLRSLGKSLALLHWPVLRPDYTNAHSRELRRLIHEGNIQVVVPGETVEANRVEFYVSPEIAPDSLPEVRAGEFSILS